MSPPSEPTLLVLSRTRLQFQDDRLTRVNEANETILDLPLESLQAARFGIRLSWLGVVLIAAGIGIHVVAASVPAPLWLQIATHVFAIAVEAFGLLGIVKDRLFLQTREGPVTVALGDPRDECQGFIASLQARIERS